MAEEVRGINNERNESDNSEEIVSLCGEFRIITRRCDSRIKFFTEKERELIRLMFQENQCRNAMLPFFIKDDGINKYSTKMQILHKNGEGRGHVMDGMEPNKGRILKEIFEKATEEGINGIDGRKRFNLTDIFERLLHSCPKKDLFKPSIYRLKLLKDKAYVDSFVSNLSPVIRESIKYFNDVIEGGDDGMHVLVYLY